MMKYMTKEAFKKAIDERRFAVKQLSTSKYEVFYLGHDDISNEFSIRRVINPDTTDGNFRMTGGGYNKAQECIERIAWYTNENAEDKDSNDLDCVDYFQHKQRYNNI